MRVSRNEMNAALKRAYEGAGYDIGDYEDAGELITWAEMCGFDVFSKLDFLHPAPRVRQHHVWSTKAITMR